MPISHGAVSLLGDGCAAGKTDRKQFKTKTKTKKKKKNGRKGRNKEEKDTKADMCVEVSFRRELLLRVLHASNGGLSYAYANRTSSPHLRTSSSSSYHDANKPQCSNLYKPTPRPGPHPCEMVPYPPRESSSWSVVTSFPTLTSFPNATFSLPVVPTTDATFTSVVASSTGGT